MYSRREGTEAMNLFFQAHVEVKPSFVIEDARRLVGKSTNLVIIAEKRCSSRIRARHEEAAKFPPLEKGTLRQFMY